MKSSKENFEKKAQLCAYHLLGARSAVVRFSGILNCEVPRSVADDIRTAAKAVVAKNAAK